MALRAVLAGRSAARTVSRARQFRPSTLSPSFSRTRVARRGYASQGGHGHKEPGSDIPWALGGIAITVPSCWYLWPTASEDGGHGHDHGHHDSRDEHEEEHKDEEAPEKAEDQSEDTAAAPDSDESEAEKDSPEADDDNADEEKDSESSKGDSEGKSAAAQGSVEKDSESSKGDSEGKSGAAQGSVEKDFKSKVEGVQGKGKTNAGDDENEMRQTRKIEENPKGGYKKRLDSQYRKELGPAAPGTPDDVDDPPVTSAGAASDSQGDISRKQFGLSNTPTRHSIAIHEDPSISKKSEGTPETAKAQGTVSVNRSAK